MDDGLPCRLHPGPDPTECLVSGLASWPVPGPDPAGQLAPSPRVRATDCGRGTQSRLGHPPPGRAAPSPSPTLPHSPRKLKYKGQGHHELEQQSWI